MEYHPDKWLVVKINSKEPHYRVFATWYGSYTEGASWKLNSGITKVDLIDGAYHFEGSSGSVYICPINLHGNSAYGYSVLQNLMKQFTEQNYGSIEVVPEETDYLKLEYS